MKKPTGNIIIVKDFSLKIRKKQRCLPSPLLFSIVLEVLARQENEIKGIGIQIGKEAVRLIVFYR